MSYIKLVNKADIGKFVEECEALIEQGYRFTSVQLDTDNNTAVLVNYPTDQQIFGIRINKDAHTDLQNAVVRNMYHSCEGKCTCEKNST